MMAWWSASNSVDLLVEEILLATAAPCHAETGEANSEKTERHRFRHGDDLSADFTIGE